MTTAVVGQAVRDAAVLIMWLALPIVVAVAIAGALAALLRVVTRLEDSSVSLLARLAGFSIAVVIFSSSIAAQVAEFASRMLALMGS
jgi:type III secretory pathway component EscS